MKALLIIVILSVCITPARGEVIIKQKNGTELTWASYTEEGDNYCTYKYGGKVCIHKKSVASIKEAESIPENADVINTKRKSNTAAEKITAVIDEYKTRKAQTEQEKQTQGSQKFRERQERAFQDYMGKQGDKNSHERCFNMCYFGISGFGTGKTIPECESLCSISR